MGILNYFWYTDFNKRDTWDMMQVVKKGRFRWHQDEFLTEDEAGLRFHEMGFDVTIFYSASKEKRLDYVNNPSGEKYKTFLNEKYHQYVQGDFRVDPNDRWKVQDGQRANVADTRIQKNILAHTDLKIQRGSDVVNDIKTHQGEGVLFLLGLDAYVLQGREKAENEPLGGHVVVSTGIEGDHFVIFDPGPPLGNGYHKPIKVVEDAVRHQGEYMFVMIKEHTSADD